MENVIRKIFSRKFDEEVHSEFIKYGRGIFENRYLLEGKKQKDKWLIKSSSEFVNFFVRKVLKNSQGEVDIKGIIVSTSDIEKDCDFPIENVKKYMGIKQLVLNCCTKGEKVLSLMDKYPRAFYALSFSIPGYDLKIKAKPPKSAKPRAKTKGVDEAPKADFCTLKTSNREIIEDLFFDFFDFKEIKVKHTIEIKEIEIPSCISDPVELREKTKRKGVLKRSVNFNGERKESEMEFEI